MAYKALDEKTLHDYLRSRPAVAEKFARGAHFSVKEVGDGNLNLMFIVATGMSRARPSSPSRH